MGKLCCPADGVLLCVNKQASFCVAEVLHAICTAFLEELHNMRVLASETIVA